MPIGPGLRRVLPGTRRPGGEPPEVAPTPTRGASAPGRRDPDRSSSSRSSRSSSSVEWSTSGLQDRRRFRSDVRFVRECGRGGRIRTDDHQSPRTAGRAWIRVVRAQRRSPGGPIGSECWSTLVHKWSTDPDPPRSRQDRRDQLRRLLVRDMTRNAARTAVSAPARASSGTSGAARTAPARTSPSISAASSHRRATYSADPGDPSRSHDSHSESRATIAASISAVGSTGSGQSGQSPVAFGSGFVPDTSASLTQ